MRHRRTEVDWERSCADEEEGVGKGLIYLALSWSTFAGGAGTYVVLQCGSAGHNIRSKPSLQGTPVGRLKLGDTFQVENEVGACDTVQMTIS